MDLGRASTFVETIDCPEIVDPTRRLLRELRITGLVEVEYKYDIRAKAYKVLDINPRVWGWQSLGAAAGVDFPYLMWLLANGEPIPECEPRCGMKWIRLSTDFMVVWREILNRRMSIGDYCRSLRSPLTGAVYAADDPLPGVLEIPILIYVVLTRIMSGRQV